ncbi:hypothetical protein KIN20_001311 [Parelaphostrongylus tenuis]|uniref:Uncharacterized protein n=1 Tax=Parelaphostrongylus tenuis TaxID=148309 RepID=A0AAD5QGW0_PARTN|nr:hypothetical protein KIN20_001311 [Parelaphostrongylus tenuis]
MIMQKVSTNISFEESLCQQTEESDLITRKFPVTPVFKKSKRKRGLRVELAEDICSTTMSKSRRKFS